jgi:glycosyltransferase involved in cell wall biosynthesis
MIGRFGYYYKLIIAGIKTIRYEGIDSFVRKVKLFFRRGSFVSPRKDKSAQHNDRIWSYPLPKYNTQYNPKISVIVPNYNHSLYLRKRLDSIYSQTYQNIEVILLDDASTDESTQILQEYQNMHSTITMSYFNDKNSGGVFYQWKKGIELARGELIWIAESDDYCSENMLAELVQLLSNQAVMLAFCRTTFVDGKTLVPTWTLEEYLANLANPIMWRGKFIKSAYQLVNDIWSIKNLVPNASSALFRNPYKLKLLNDNNWLNMRMCGDWVFYLHVIRGGLVGYSPNAVNYFRQHTNNTSVQIHKKDIYYREHEIVARTLLDLYYLKHTIFDRLRYSLEIDWRMNHPGRPKDEFKNYYNFEPIHCAARNKANILMAIYALVAGGGETFPIKLANLLKEDGYSVTILNCNQIKTEPSVRSFIRPDIPLLELDQLDQLGVVVKDLGIDIIHSHHASVDYTICTLLENCPCCKVVITTHGMYELMSEPHFLNVIPLLCKRVDQFIYTADKNLKPFVQASVDLKHFTKISNALDVSPINPVARDTLGIKDDDFVLTLVSRAIPEKGWDEGIRALRLARQMSGKDIHLLLIGEGPEYIRLRNQVKDNFIHFLGFRSNIRDFFATSDIGFLPSRFQGESFPLVIIDCLLSGRPVLASNVGEISNMIKAQSKQAGSLFDLDNWTIPINHVAKLIAEYATNNVLYAEHLQAVSLAAKKFDTKEMLHKYESVYRDLIGIREDV